ncbi:MAG TPA: MauE/DoxX family redox-associated membrane protein [Candidatus Baltobacteraceae bacterium]|nr:MauE/DoxX family redox-associated membrane protein [Candidatus Baltobacteraceae bacterium]
MSIVVLVLRVLVGGVFLAAGGLKIGHAAFFASELAAMRFLPSVIIPAIALFLPILEITLGIYLLAGLFVRGAALLACAQLLILAGIVASVIMRHIPTSCGCFGPADTAVASWNDVVRDLVLAAGAVVIAMRPPGRCSLDAYWKASVPPQAHKE